MTPLFDIRDIIQLDRTEHDYNACDVTTEDTYWMRKCVCGAELWQESKGAIGHDDRSKL